MGIVWWLNDASRFRSHLPKEGVATVGRLTDLLQQMGFGPQGGGESSTAAAAAAADDAALTREGGGGAAVMGAAPPAAPLARTSVPSSAVGDGATADEGAAGGKAPPLPSGPPEGPGEDSEAKPLQGTSLFGRMCIPPGVPFSTSDPLVEVRGGGVRTPFCCRPPLAPRSSPPRTSNAGRPFT